MAGVVLAGCAQPKPPAPAVKVAYTILAAAPVGATVALARVIVDLGESCPRLVTEAGTVAMAARGNPDPSHFPVTVCEAPLPLGTAARVEGTDLQLPPAATSPSHITLVGDTGCGTWQDCANPAAWPFATIARQAAEGRPDLVIHMGDYVYRGTPGSIEVAGVKRGTYNAGNYALDDVHCQLRDPYVSQNGPGSSLPDSWDAWQKDFFAPAAPLLSQAPWVVARGNHELCSRAGPGWFYFLDPNSDLLGGELRCPPQGQGGDALPNLILSPPYALDLGAMRLLVMDSANACDQHPNFPDRFAAQFADLSAAHDGRPAWLLTHRPIWGVDWLDQGTYQTSNVTLQQALRHEPDSAMPAGVELVLSGHIHRFEALTVAGTGRPPQLVIGNSGISLERDELAGKFETGLDGATVQGLAINEFGHLEARLEPAGGWTGRLVGTGGQAMAVCRSGVPGAAICQPALP